MVYVSDHCVLRYLERVKGIDIEAVRAEIATPALDTAVRFGCDTVRRGDGSRVKLVGNVAQTVLGKEMRPRGRRRA